MIVTVGCILLILLVMATTYPKEFPTLISNPEQLLQAIGLESRRRWLLLTLGSELWVSKMRLRYSLWRAQPIIKSERLKQQQKEIDID